MIRERLRALLAQLRGEEAPEPSQTSTRRQARFWREVEDGWREAEEAAEPDAHPKDENASAKDTP